MRDGKQDGLHSVFPQDIFSEDVSRKTPNDNQNTMHKKRHIRKTGSKGRPERVLCTALIPLNTSKIRKTLLDAYQKKKKELEKLESEITQSDEKDKAAFRNFLISRFGAETTRMRELTEEIHLLAMRLDKIQTMAEMVFMTPGRYYHHLESKVTPEADVWTVLENEIQAFREEERQRREEFERKLMEDDSRDEEETPFDEEFDDNIFEDFDDSDDDDFFEDFDEDDMSNLFGDEEESPFEDFFKKIFSKNKHKKEDENDSKSLKKLYRELCTRYHPDKIGAHDAKTKQIWLSIQEAYETRNLQRLRAIHANLELESGKSELRCSDIRTMIDTLKFEIHTGKRQLQALRREVHWNFTDSTDKHKQKLEKMLAEEFRSDIRIAERELKNHEIALDRIRTSYQPKKKAQKAKNTAHPKPAKGKARQDFFQMDFDL